MSMVRGCMGDGNAGVGDGGGMAVCSGHEYVGGTLGSGIEFTVQVLCAADALGMSVVRGMRGVGKMCMCLAQDGVGCGGRGVCEWIRGMGFTNPV